MPLKWTDSLHLPTERWPGRDGMDGCLLRDV